jgi:glucosylceramidase
MKKSIKIFLLVLIFFSQLKCSSGDKSNPSPPPIKSDPVVANEVDFWLTKGNESVKLQKQSTILGFGTISNTYPNIEVDESQTYQTIDGFGYTLTGGSAEVINTLNATKKQELLQELFGTTDTSIGVSYLRISIGASDLNSSAYTYDDMPTGQTDLTLANFSLTQDANGVIALLKQILLINPNIKILATPWSAPAWMKSSNSLVLGSLQTQYYDVYSKYFVKYIQKMAQEGITINAVTPQNEPENQNANNPTMLMNATEQLNFIKNNLGPAFQTAGIITKIIAFDHNCDNNGAYPISVLNDAAAKAFTDGSAFHLYAGDINVLSTVHNAHPTKNIYFTEQYTDSNGNFGIDLKWHLKNVIVGSMRNWSKNALEWNLANDPSFGPHTAGGCTNCKGALTINSSTNYDRNVAYYIIAHASKFVPAGSIRISSNVTDKLNNVAFKTPSGKKVLIIENDGDITENFNIKFNGKWVTTSIEAGSVGTYIW